MPSTDESTRNLTTSWAWRIPTLVQAGLPALVMILILFFPESPRWLIAHDRREEALAIFAKYHGDGNENSAIVQLQYHEIIEQLHEFRDENPWWDFRELVNTRGARYRLYMVIGMSFFGQWSGNNVVSYFMVGTFAVSLPPGRDEQNSNNLYPARDDSKCWHNGQEQTTPDQRHQPNL
jgi:MFS family permease